jgi:hypothetical protein
MAVQRFQLESSIDESTGRTVAVYLRVRDGKVAQTKEICEGVAYADYDKEGILLGLELLGPCQNDVLERVTASEPEAVRRFLLGGVPRDLVAA